MINPEIGEFFIAQLDGGFTARHRGMDRLTGGVGGILEHLIDRVFIVEAETDRLRRRHPMERTMDTTGRDARQHPDHGRRVIGIAALLADDGAGVEEDLLGGHSAAANLSV